MKIIIPIILCLVAGCQTSPVYSTGTTRILADGNSDMIHYANGDPVKLAQVKALQSAAGKTTETITALWAPVKAWLVPAIQSDPAIGPEERRLRLNNIALFDELNAAEKARPLR